MTAKRKGEKQNDQTNMKHHNENTHNTLFKCGNTAVVVDNWLIINMVVLNKVVCNLEKADHFINYEL